MIFKYGSSFFLWTILFDLNVAHIKILSLIIINRLFYKINHSLNSNNKSAILITFKNRLFQLINSPYSRSCSDIEKGSSQVDLFTFLEIYTYRMHQRTSKAMRKMFN